MRRPGSGGVEDSTRLRGVSYSVGPVAELGTISARPRGDDAAADPAAHADDTLGITVIMPAFNEAPNLADVVPRTAAVLGALEDGFEILVVDDGSTDGTAEVMTELGKHHPELRLLRLRRNYGKSTALQAGFERARGDVVVLMDADGQDRPEEILKLLGALDDGLDLATGRRVQRNDRRASTTASPPPSPASQAGTSTAA